MSTCLIAALRPRVAAHSHSPLNPSDSGSGPSVARSGCASDVARMPQHAPEAARIVAAASRCRRRARGRGGRACRRRRAGTTHRLPDMPRWTISVPPSQRMRRYLARRSMAPIARASSCRSKPGAIGQRSPRWRTVTCVKRRPARPRLEPAAGGLDFRQLRHGPRLFRIAGRQGQQAFPGGGGEVILQAFVLAQQHELRIALNDLEANDLAVLERDGDRLTGCRG